MPNKNRDKALKLAVFSGLFYAGGLALFDYGDGVDFRLGKFIFIFLFFGGAMGWMLFHPQKENELLPLPLGSPVAFLFLCKRNHLYGKTSPFIFY